MNLHVRRVQGVLIVHVLTKDVIKFWLLHVGPGTIYSFERCCRVYADPCGVDAHDIACTMLVDIECGWNMYRTVNLMALPQPDVMVTSESVIVGRNSGYLRKEWTWIFGQGAEVKIVNRRSDDLFWWVSWSTVFQGGHTHIADARGEDEKYPVVQNLLWNSCDIHITYRHLDCRKFWVQKLGISKTEIGLVWQDFRAFEEKRFCIWLSSFEITLTWDEHICSNNLLWWRLTKPWGRIYRWQAESASSYWPPRLVRLT